jgi:hypothetical protein
MIHVDNLVCTCSIHLILTNIKVTIHTTHYNTKQLRISRTHFVSYIILAVDTDYFSTLQYIVGFSDEDGFVFCEVEVQCLRAFQA